MLVPLPSIYLPFQSIDWTPIFPQQANKSGFTSRTQVVSTPGAEQWTARAVTCPPAGIGETRLWRAFVIACRGAENTFHLPALPMRQYSGAQPTVTAAVAGNRAVTLSSIEAIRLGMYATVHQVDGHRRLVVVVGAEGATIHFEPYLSADPVIGDAFEIVDPYARVRFADPKQRLPPLGSAFALDVEEAL